MSPMWSSRLLSPSGSNATPNRPSQNPVPRDRAPARAPQEYLDPPTLNPGGGQSSSPRPQSSGHRGHAHSRSVSHPLTSMFGRNKSSGNLKFDDTDVPWDDDLVPVLEDSHKQQLPTRVVFGKKGRLDDGVKTARRCMCCDSKVNVPKELQKFRCLNCLTINDLKPIEQQSDDEKSRSKAERAGASNDDVPKGARPPLSVEKTRAIIDQCLIAYLESKCKTEGNVPAPSLQGGLPNQSVAVHDATLSSSPIKPVLSHDSYASASRSPPVTPGEVAYLSPFAATLDFTDPDASRGAYSGSPRQEQAPSPGRTQKPAIPRKAVPAQPSRRPPPPPSNVETRPPSRRNPPEGNLTPSGKKAPALSTSPGQQAEGIDAQQRYERSKRIFKPLEDYMNTTLGDFQSVNGSFSTVRPAPPGRSQSEEMLQTQSPRHTAEQQQTDQDQPVFELDAKMLLLGDIGENGSWWTGKHERSRHEKALKRKKIGETPLKMVTTKSPNIDWQNLRAWYSLIHYAGCDWQTKAKQLRFDELGLSKDQLERPSFQRDVEDDLYEARNHSIRALLKITENLLKRPSRPLKEPEDMRFLLILLCNPSLYPSSIESRRDRSGTGQRVEQPVSDQAKANFRRSPMQRSPRKMPVREGSQHNGLLKRIFGLIAHSNDTCHRYLISWFSRLDEGHFVAIVDIVASFVTHRIGRRSRNANRKSTVDDGGLIPDLSGSAMNTSAQLHSAMGLSGSIKKTPDNPNAEPDWAVDWQIKGAAKFMSLLFAANNNWQGKKGDGDASRIDSLLSASSLSPQAKARRSGQLLHTSSFYNTLLDYSDMIADYKVWESKRDKFAFCQYPLFLSMGSKIKILEYDARRQMELKAREAYFDQVIRQRANDGNLHLRVRRECLVDDSLRQISEAVGSGHEELKKGLRVHFSGEEGVDAGGPRKEWFLMLVRDVFDPNHGMFVYDDESHTCYFNPNSFETSDQYYLVGALLGLAIYNSTILDVAFPPFAFRKLLAAAPPLLTDHLSVSSLTGTKGQMTYTVADLAEFRPSLAAGLQQLLDFDGDVEATYCRDFVAPVERYGAVTQVPLMPNGERTPVTNANRQQFVDAYVRYLLDTAVARQFEPFKRGFFTVCAGNALSLFRAEEIELLVRGSDERLDVNSLRAVAVHEGWRHPAPPHAPVAQPADAVPVVAWFWALFAAASPARQRSLLTFVTGSDRIPAVGATSLVLRVVAGGDGWGGGGAAERARFPIARTCFNMLVLWHYESREQLEEKLWRAVEESEGFGLK